MFGKTKGEGVYEANVTLGEKYRDEQTGVEGTAVTVSFFQHGCTRVTIEWSDGKDVSGMGFDEPRLKGPKGAAYESDVVLGEKYKDEQTGITGTATVVTFHQHGCERVALEFVAAGEVKEQDFDAPRLTSLESGKTARSERTGGPTRGASHNRPGAVGRQGRA